MIQIRDEMFETNSSSVHIFCIPGHKSLRIPKELKISTISNYVSLEEDSPIIDRIAYMYDLAKDNGYEDAFISYLRAKGINIIDDREYEFNSYMLGNDFTEEELDNFLFNPDAKYLYESDYTASVASKLERLEDEGYQFVEVRN